MCRVNPGFGVEQGLVSVWGGRKEVTILFSYVIVERESVCVRVAQQREDATTSNEEAP